MDVLDGILVGMGVIGFIVFLLLLWGKRILVWCFKEYQYLKRWDMPKNVFVITMVCWTPDEEVHISFRDCRGTGMFYIKKGLNASEMLVEMLKQAESLLKKRNIGIQPCFDLREVALRIHSSATCPLDIP